MSREELLQILNTSSDNSIEKILRAYCVEKGKQEEHINVWLTPFRAPFNPFLQYYTECFEIALRYFRDKHNINALLKPHNEGYEVIYYY